MICINEDRQELYSTNENLMDGTTCSYDNEDNICIQASIEKTFSPFRDVICETHTTTSCFKFFLNSFVLDFFRVNVI